MATASTDELLTKKKREHLRQLEKLRREATKSERECRLHVSSFHHRANNAGHGSGAVDAEGNLSTLDAEIKRLTSERETELKRLSQQLTSTKMSVRKFRESVAKSKQRLPPSPAVLEDLRTKMVDIESHVSAFKAQQKSVYDDLNRVETQCCNEIASLEKKMIAWEQQQQQTRPLSARSGTSSSAALRLFPSGDASGDLPAAVVAFEKFQQQSGGVCGGWNEEDHSIFLRVRQKHKGKTNSAFIEEALPLLAPRSADDLHHHETWFREHEKLLEAKKTAIEEWRKGKRVKQQEESDSYRETEGEEMEKRRVLDAARRERDEKEKARKEAEVAAWKEAKEAEKAREENEKRAQQEEAKRKAELEASRKAKLREKAEEFAREREEAKRAAQAEEARREKRERQVRRKNAAEEIMRFQERDQMTVAQRIVFNQRRVEEEQEKAKRLEKMKENVAVNVERDPERLVRPTKGMEERKKAQQQEEEEGKRRNVKGMREGAASCNVRQIQHRATPSWRAGV